MTRALTIPAPDGQIDATLYTPAGATGPLPAVVMFTDIGGLRAANYAKAQRIADGGYAVLLPNIYYRQGPGEMVPAGKSFRDGDVMPTLAGYTKAFTPEALARDFAALVAGIDAEPAFAPGGIAAVGYCLTGKFTLRMAALHPDRVVAAAGFHSAGLAPDGDPTSVVGLVGSIKARVYFGHADKDGHLPPDQIARMDGALAEAGVHFTTELYRGALHGFTSTDTPSYDAAADALHYRRLFTLFDETLRAA